MLHTQPYSLLCHAQVYRLLWCQCVPLIFVFSIESIPAIHHSLILLQVPVPRANQDRRPIDRPAINLRQSISLPTQTTRQLPQPEEFSSLRPDFPRPGNENFQGIADYLPPNDDYLPPTNEYLPPDTDYLPPVGQ